MLLSKLKPLLRQGSFFVVRSPYLNSKRYCVRPNAGTIQPNGDAEIKVMLQPGQIDEKHKFMVQSIFGKSCG